MKTISSQHQDLRSTLVCWYMFIQTKHFLSFFIDGNMILFLIHKSSRNTSLWSVKQEARLGDETVSEAFMVFGLGIRALDASANYQDTKNTISLEQRYMILYHWVHDLSHSSKYFVEGFLRINVITCYNTAWGNCEL